MRVLLIGQKAFGSDALAALADEPVELVGAVVAAADQRRADPLEAAAKARGIDCLKTASLGSGAVSDWVTARRPDLLVMAFVTLYLPMSLAALAPLGAINFHPSLLPAHRGISALPWTILCGDRLAGLSVYFVDEGVDTGDVIVQKSVEIGEDDDVKTLYFKKIYPLGVRALCEAVALVAAGNPPRIRQDEAAAGYDPPLSREHLLIDWGSGLEDARRKIRAGNPGPGGVALLDGREARIYGGRRSPRPAPIPAAPGAVLAIDRDGIHVTTADGVLLITSLGYAGCEKMQAAGFAAAHALTDRAVFTNARHANAERCEK